MYAKITHELGWQSRHVYGLTWINPTAYISLSRSGAAWMAFWIAWMQESLCSLDSNCEGTLCSKLHPLLEFRHSEYASPLSLLSNLWTRWWTHCAFMSPDWDMEEEVECDPSNRGFFETLSSPIGRLFEPRPPPPPGDPRPKPPPGMPRPVPPLPSRPGCPSGLIMIFHPVCGNPRHVWARRCQNARIQQRSRRWHCGLGCSPKLGWSKLGGFCRSFPWPCLP